MKNPLKPPSLRHHSTPVRVLLILVAVVVGGFVAVMVLGVGLMLAGYEAEPEQAAPPAAAVSTPTPETAGTTPPAEPEPAPTSTPEPAETTAAPEPAEAPEPEPTADVAGFEQWLKDNFYETSTWYPHVTGSEDVFGSLWIHTNIYPDAEGKSFAQPICTAGKFYMMEQDSDAAVMVRAADGQRLADC